MNKKLILGAILFVPTVSFAHDSEHVTTAWYQNPLVLTLTVLTVIALGILCYGWVSKRKNLQIVPAVALVVIAVTSFAMFSQPVDTYEPELAMADFGTGQTVTLYKSPNCGCCSGHAKALEEAGFAVNIVETDELDQIKSEQNIPPTGASCHTSVIGDYVVEGHVPLEAIEKLLTEKPDVAGIGLPGMPIGTPGMPGRKTAPYEVYQLTKDGEMSPYMTI